MRLHVRAIIRDGTRAFVGSQSLRKEELDSRREVGLLVNNPAVTRKLMQVFEADWQDWANEPAVEPEKMPVEADRLGAGGQAHVAGQVQRETASRGRHEPDVRALLLEAAAEQQEPALQVVLPLRQVE